MENPLDRIADLVKNFTSLAFQTLPYLSHNNFLETPELQNAIFIAIRKPKSKKSIFWSENEFWEKFSNFLRVC